MTEHCVVKSALIVHHAAVWAVMWVSGMSIYSLLGKDYIHSVRPKTRALPRGKGNPDI